MLSNYKLKTERKLRNIVSIIPFIEPNIITILGGIVSLLFFVAILKHAYVIALALYILSAFDMLDGVVARMYNKETAFGGFLDSTLDRISDFLIITSFAFANLVRWEIAAPLLLFSFITSYIRSRAELSAKGKISVAVGLIERPERLIIIGISLFLYILFPAIIFYGYNIFELIFVLLALLSFLTVIQRMWFAYKNL